jgi:hypothetical protein
MPIAKGVSKKVAYKKESAWGTLPGATGGKYIRRVTSAFNLAKDTYESNEIRTDYQVADMRHGVRSADGSVNGEFSPGAYTDFIQSVVAKDFIAGVSAASLSITMAAGAGTGVWVITRASGSFLTDGFNVGNIVRLSGGTLNAANSANNALVIAVTALTMTIKVLSGTAMVAEGTAVTGVTIAVIGKETFAPLSGHTDDSYTFEEFYSDIAQSEVYTGMKVGGVNLQLPSTGLVTTDITLKGKNLEQTGTTQYFTTPAVATSNGIFAAVNGAVIVNGTAYAVITSADISIERGLEAAQVVGSNFAADVFTGRIKVSGNVSVYFQDATFRTFFDQEQTVSLVIALTSDNSKTAQAVSITLPKVKFGTATKSDSENGIISQHSFTALLNADTSTGLEATTIQIQDTSI